MSLFDVIKYPLSDPPTYDELIAIPVEIIVQWLHESRYSLDMNAPLTKERHDFLCRWALDDYSKYTWAAPLSVLKKIIKEMP